MTALALVAAALVTLFSPATASAAPVTATFQEGVDGYAGTTDTTLSEIAPTASDPDDDRLEVIEGDPDPDSLRSLIKFDLDGEIQRGSTVSGTTAITFTIADPGQDINAYVLNRSWSEAEATWTDAATGSPWNVPGTGGTDRVGTPVGTIDMSGAIGTTTTLTIPNATAQAWINDPTSNHGIVLISTENNDTADVYSSERADETQRPVLTVTHEAPAPVVVTTTSPLPGGVVNSLYTPVALTASGGTAPYTWTVTDGVLPAGLALSTAGQITGTPTAATSTPFTVTATDIYGATGELEVTLPVAAAPAGGVFTGITPERAYDTREDGSLECITGVRDINVTALATVPDDAAAVALNVTVVSPRNGGFVTVFPTGETRPVASSLNFGRGGIVANAVTTPVGTGGNISVYASGGSCPHVVVDVAGHYAPGAVAPGGFAGITPERAYDTREDGSLECVTGVRDIDVTALATVPDDAAAVALNVTVVSPRNGGFVTVFPTGETRPVASNLNFGRGGIVANAVTTPVGTDGNISVYASGGSCPHVVVDVAGYFAPGTPVPGGFAGITPERAYDTREDGSLECITGVRDINVTALATVPDDAAAVALNVTVVSPRNGGFLTVFPTGQSRPLASNINFGRGGIIPNAVTTPVGTDGNISVYASGGSCPHVVVDVAGYYVGAEI